MKQDIDNTNLDKVKDTKIMLSWLKYYIEEVIDRGYAEFITGDSGGEDFYNSLKRLEDYYRAHQKDF